MRFLPTALHEVVVVEPRVHEDGRGVFFEFHNREAFRHHGISVEFIQDNHSVSKRGVLRGLHFQQPPKAQAKLVRVVKGEIFDVAVDVRPDSPTFGKYVVETLSAENRKMLFIPAGFAHGFCSMADNTEVIYKVSEVYSVRDEGGILWNDPEIAIPWPKIQGGYILSEKDKLYPRLKDFQFRRLI
jgi:dTDP-4-dehydrorhamnose 3,5-epimerase